jgi:hypothetical protein
MKLTLGPWFRTVLFCNFPTLLLAAFALIGRIGWSLGVTWAGYPWPGPGFVLTFPLFMAAPGALFLATLIACIAVIRPTVSIFEKVSIALVIVTSALLVRSWYSAAEGRAAEIWKGMVADLLMRIFGV